MTRHARGFSLIEMAFVLVIVTLLLGGLLVPFATQVEQKRIAETNKTLEEIKEALLGFAVANGRLPCVDTDNDGFENAVCTAATTFASEGNLPWATLGLGNGDVWGDRFRYRVTNTFADTLTPFTLATAGMLTVCGALPSGAPVACPANQTLANAVPAVVLSHGKNGEAFSCTPVPAGRADECENTDLDNFFVSRVITGPNTGAGEFDDQVIWLSPNVLFNRMVAAGRLP